MKKIITLLVFLGFTICSYAQFDSTETAERVLPKKKKNEIPRFAITAGGGLSWRVAQLPEELSKLEKAFYKDLLYGNSVDASAMYYFNRHFGFGLRYNNFISTARLDDIVVTFDTTNGGFVNVFGDLKEQTQISLYGATFGGRVFNYPRTGYFFYNATVGFMTYNDEVKISYKKQTIKGNTLGLMLSAGYAVLVNKHIGLNIGFNYASGSLTEYTITNDGTSRTQRLPEEQPEGLQHFDFKAEVFFMF